MNAARILCLLSLALRGVVLLAVLALSPLYLTAHKMPPTDTAMTDKMAQPSSHAAGGLPDLPGRHDAACRIFCLGWVNAPNPARGDIRADMVAAVPMPEITPLHDGIAPAPGRHPPKLPALL